MDNEKNNQSLELDDLDKVSGGYIESKYDSNCGSSTAIVRCDNCGHENAIPISGKLGGGHLCISCMKRIKNELGDDALNAILKKN